MKRKSFCLFAILAALAVGFVSIRAQAAQASISITVYKTPACTCCEEWGKHLKENGFEVTIVKKEDFFEFKKQFGVPDHVQSCHVGVVGDKFFEGHIPAAAIQAFLENNSTDRGLAVPGMPLGSPGMPSHGRPESYTVYRVKSDNSTDVFQRVVAEL